MFSSRTDCSHSFIETCRRWHERTNTSERDHALAIVECQRATMLFCVPRSLNAMRSRPFSTATAGWSSLLPVNKVSLAPTTSASTSPSFAVKNPATGSIIATVLNATPIEQQLSASIGKACAVFPHLKGSTSTYRSNLLKNWAAEIRANKKVLASIMTAECGKPLRESEGEVEYGAAFLDFYSGEALRPSCVGGGEIVPSPFSQASDSTQSRGRLLSVNEAVGVCGFITPWNFPLGMIARKVAPAIAAGCPAVVKPSELTPLTAIAMGTLASRAGFRDGCLEFVCGGSDASKMIGNALCTDDRVRKISFTGSTRVGKELLRRSAEGGIVKRISLELGGNAPFIVFEDAKIDVAVKAAMASKFRNAGQTCVCADRFLVHKDVLPAFTAALQAAVEAFVVGDGAKETTTMGPLITPAAVDSVARKVDAAIVGGATLVTGGKRLEKLGANFYAPTILTYVKAVDEIFCTETFGPVVSIVPFSTEEEALIIANDSGAGLASYFCTQDMERVFRFSAALETGLCGVNEGIMSTAFAPFGGVKQSGIGREGGLDGILEYVEKKYILLNV